MPRRHHVVSQGYLRFFGEGERIRLITKEPLQDGVIGVRDTFVEKGFNAYRTSEGVVDDLESQWARLEAEALPAIRAAIDANDLPTAHVEIKVLASVHVARSYQLRQLHDASFDKYLADPTGDMDVGRLEAAFLQEHGREPLAGEIEEIVRANFIEMRASKTVMVERMASIHNKILEEWLAPLHVQPISVRAHPAMELVTGDSPVVRASSDRLRVRVAFGDAGVVYMPLSRRKAVCLTTQPQDGVVLLPIELQRTNWLVWRSALARLACHPDADWRWSLGLSRI